MDLTEIIVAVVGVAVGIAAGFYAGFRKSAASDGKQDWKDVVVQEVDLVADKIEETKKS